MWGLSVARTRTWVELEGTLGTRFEGAPLEADETANTCLRDGQECVQPGAAERHLLGGSLHFHELAGAGHDDVHVDLGGGVLGVVQVEQRLALDDADADGGHTVPDRGRGLQTGNAADGVGDRDEAAGDGGGARAAVGLDDVAVHPHCALAELAPVDDSAERPADEPLNLLRPAARPAVLPLRPGVGRAREHRVLGGDPSLPLALQERRHLVLDRRRADDLRRAEFHEHRALGVQEKIPRDGDGPELIGGAAVGPGHR